MPAHLFGAVCGPQGEQRAERKRERAPGMKGPRKKGGRGRKEKTKVLIYKYGTFFIESSIDGCVSLMCITLHSLIPLDKGFIEESRLPEEMAGQIF